MNERRRRIFILLFSTGDGIAADAIQFLPAEYSLTADVDK